MTRLVSCRGTVATFAAVDVASSHDPGREVSIAQLLHPVLRFEVFRNAVVQACNDLIDGFLPRLFPVFATLDSFDELSQSCLYCFEEASRHLKIHQEKEDINSLSYV